MKTLLSRVFLFVLVVIAPAFLSTWTIREDGKLKAQDPSAGQREINFAREVQPLLARRCFACHGPDKAEGGLRLHESDKASPNSNQGN